MKIGRKDAALNCLKLRKMYEEREGRVESMFMSVQATLDSIAESEMNKLVFDTITEGTRALKTMNESMANVEQVMDDLHEAIAESRDITEIVSQQHADMGLMAEYDDDDLMEELRALDGDGKQKEKPSAKEKNEADTAAAKVKLDAIHVPTDEVQADPLKTMQVPTDDINEPEKIAEREKVSA